MRRLTKRVLALLMLCAILLSGQVAVRAADHWAKDDIETATTRGYIDAAGFLPDATATRADVAQMLWRALDRPAAEGDCPFADVADDAPYRTAVTVLFERKITEGIGDGNFGPDGAFTREMGLTMLARAWGLTAKDENACDTFADAGSISSWARPAVSAMFENGYVKGVGENQSAPAKELNFAEVVTLLVRVTDGETAKTKPASPTGGGNRDYVPPTPKPDTTPPAVTYTLSETEETENPVTILIDTGTHTDVKELRWVRIHERSLRAQTEYNDAYMLAGATFEGADDAFDDDRDAWTSNLYGGEPSILQSYSANAQVRIDGTDEYADVTAPVVDGKLAVTQNGLYAFCAEDYTGNRYFFQVFISNIKRPTAEIVVTVKDDYSNGFVATAQIEDIAVNASNSIVQMVLVKKLPYMPLGGSWMDGNQAIRMELAYYQHHGGVIEPYDDTYALPGWGDYHLFLEDEWGNWNRITANVPKPSGGTDHVPPTISHAMEGNFILNANVTDDSGVAYVGWAKCAHNSHMNDLDCYYSAREKYLLLGDALAVIPGERYVLYAMDTVGNVACELVEVPFLPSIDSHAVVTDTGWLPGSGLTPGTAKALIVFTDGSMWVDSVLTVDDVAIDSAEDYAALSSLKGQFVVVELVHGGCNIRTVPNVALSDAFFERDKGQIGSILVDSETRFIIAGSDGDGNTVYFAQYGLYGFQHMRSVWGTAVMDGEVAKLVFISSMIYENFRYDYVYFPHADYEIDANDYHYYNDVYVNDELTNICVRHDAYAGIRPQTGALLKITSRQSDGLITAFGDVNYLVNPKDIDGIDANTIRFDGETYDYDDDTELFVITLDNEVVVASISDLLNGGIFKVAVVNHTGGYLNMLYLIEIGG